MKIIIAGNGKVGNTLRNSVYNQIIWGLEMLGVIRLTFPF